MIWFLLLPLLIYAPSLGSVWMMPGGEFSDLLISHYPNAIWIQRALFEYHQVPFWSDTILSGYPFAADPLSGLWYPPGWIGVFLPFPVGFNLAFLLHLLWGGIGLYLFLRYEKIAPLPALIGGILFELFPKISAHYVAGHVTLVYAVCWTPWLLLAETRQRSENDWRKWLIGPGLAMGMIALADVRWTLPAGLLWLALFVRRIAAIERLKWSIRSVRSAAGYVGAQITLGGMLAAPQLLPLMEYTRLTTRSALTAGDVFEFSLPLGRLLGLVFPSFGSNAEWILYPGAVGFICVFLALLIPDLRKRGSFWLWTAFACLIFALGDTLPGLSMLGELPGFNLMRVPPRVLFIAGICIAIVTAFTLDALTRTGETVQAPRFNKAADLGVVGLGAFGLIFTIGICLVIKQTPLNILWGGGILAVVSIWMGLYRTGKIRATPWLVGLLFLLVIDLGMVDFKSMQARDSQTLSSEASEVASYLADQPGRFRVYSPSYSLPQQVAVKYGLELADGVDPLQLTSYQQYMQAATGIPSSGYSVTLPPYATGDPVEDNQEYLPDVERLGRLNVRFIVSAYDLQAPDLALIHQIGSTRIYENLHALPRAWVEDEVGPIRDRAADVVTWEPNRIRVSAKGPGMLVLSEISYPGWQVEVDGQRAIDVTVDGILRGVMIGDGKHTVDFTYRPIWVSIGLVLAGLAVIVLGWAWIGTRRHSG